MEAIFMMASISQQIKDIVNNGIEILEKGFGTTLESMLIQLTATIILILAVRYLLWNKVTAILEERKRLIEAGLVAKDEAQAEAVRIQEENKRLLEEAKKEAQEIIESAKKRGYSEAEQIISEAKQQAENELKRAKEAIEAEKIKAEDYISEQIIDTAFLLSQKILQEELDPLKHQELVNNFLGKMENK